MVEQGKDQPPNSGCRGGSAPIVLGKFEGTNRLEKSSREGHSATKNREEPSESGNSKKCASKFTFDENKKFMVGNPQISNTILQPTISREISSPDIRRKIIEISE